MGIKNLLQHLPGGKECHHSFYELGMKDDIVPIDAAGALYQFASYHAADYLKGNYGPSLIQFGRWLVYLRSICGWRMTVYLDGMENEAKKPERERRQARMAKAVEENNLRGQVKNNPKYISLAAGMCKFLNIHVVVSMREADPQISRACIDNGDIPVTGDSDLLAYGVNPSIIIALIKSSWVCAKQLAPCRTREHLTESIIQYISPRPIYVAHSGC